MNAVPLIVPIAVVLVVVAVVAMGPSPVVVLGLPVLPASGRYADRVWVTLTVSACDEELDRAEVAVAGGGRLTVLPLRHGTNRVLVDALGHTTLTWVVTTERGGTTTGSAVVAVQPERALPQRARHQVRLAA